MGNQNFFSYIDEAANVGVRPLVFLGKFPGPYPAMLTGGRSKPYRKRLDNGTSI